MAELKLTVGTVSASKTASNAKATEVLAAFLEGRVPAEELAAMSNQQKLDFIVQAIAGWLGGDARAKARADAEAALVVVAPEFED